MNTSPGRSYIGNYTKNITPSNLAACLSHDCQSLYSRQEFSFSYNDSFNFYNYISELEQFSYQHDVMNKSNIFTLSLVNETLWDLDKSMITHKAISNETNIPLVETIQDSSTIVPGRETDKEVVHRSYGFIPIAIPEFLFVLMKVVSLGSNLQNNGGKKFTNKLVDIGYQITKVPIYVCLLL